MQIAENGRKVKVHYIGTLKDGTVFDSTDDKEPFEFTLGENKVIPGFEKGIVGMNVNDRKSFIVNPSEGYGTIRNDLIIKYPKNNIPDEMEVSLGQKLKLSSQDGNSHEVIVTDIQEDYLLLDANHPLAGKDLHFDIELVGITE